MEPTTPEPPHQKRSRRGLRLLLILVALPVVVLALCWFFFQGVSRSRLGRAIAEADRLDPGWRWAQLNSKRTTVTESENSSVMVEAAHKALPANWPAAAKDGEEGHLRGANLIRFLDLSKRPPPLLLDAPVAEGLRDELAELEAPLGKVDALADAPHGRSDRAISPAAFDVALAITAETRMVSRMIMLQGVSRAQDGDIDGSLNSCRAMINAARSLGDELTLLSLLVRNAITSNACEMVQRSLAQGVPTDEALRKLQDLLADEASQPTLVFGLRGERASSFELFDQLSSGALPMAAFAGGGARPPTVGSRITAFIGEPYFRHNQCLTLESLNRAVEIAKLPVVDQPERWKIWEREATRSSGMAAKAAGMMASLMTPAMAAATKSYLWNRATLNAAIVMVAAERFRIANHRWPLSADELVPTFLRHHVLDPFTKAPIRILPFKAGIIVYSVGPDGTDDGGTFKTRALSGTDVGYRLWNVDARRRSPADELPADVFESAIR